MDWTIVGWAGVLLACLVAGVLIVRGPVRRLAEEMQAERARALFRPRREWLEADFLSALGHLSPTERVRWEDAHWHDEVHWARDRKTRRLLALIAVHFDPGFFDEQSDPAARQATALFEFRQGRWHAEGQRLECACPGEVFLRNQAWEPLLVHPRRAG
jgi:hypothetical protein